jgi:uncharacterized membrane protein
VLDGIGPRRLAFNRGFVRLVDGAGHWLARHWLAVVNSVLAVWVGVAVLTPVAYALGFTGPARSVFGFYRFACDQIPSHSLHILGYQLCLCERCLAIYSSLLLMGILLIFVRKYRAIRALPFWGWLLFMVPMALDGGTQFFGWRESDLLLRLITGALFGIGTALYLLPQLEAAAGPQVEAVATQS